MRYLKLIEVLALHRRLIERSGGALGIRDFGLLESAIAQPRMTFGGEDLYSTEIEKAAALGFSIVMNHPFVDGNKRTGHAAMETFLLLNGREIRATVDEQIATARQTPAEFDRYERLLANPSRSIEQQQKLDELRWNADRFMLRKAHAAALLRWRGHIVPATV
ncbi:type II toxin-antitoxin system death-on-curing family toxin [Geitlerinema sp. CS-897]|nr:type II toxin-antitoxin system death-on-curing family toxin [Geitlerinema sp. CS-897]